MLTKICLYSLPKQQSYGAIYAFSVRTYSSDFKDIQNVRVIKNTDPAALRRGTGGRSSFNGYVATVFGATGFLGKSLTNQLGKIGTQLIIPYRGNFDDEEVKSLKLTGDLGQVLFQHFYLKDYDSIKKAIKYSNVVINLIGRHFETKNFSYEDVHVQGARAIARACREVGVDRLIHVSSLSVTENPPKFYMRKPCGFLPSKLRGEAAVKEEFPDVTIVRPATMTGWDSKFLWHLCEPLRGTQYSLPVWKKGRETIKQPVWVTDVSRGIVEIMKDHTTKGKTYQFLGPHRYYLEEIVRFVLDGTQRTAFGWTYHDARFDPWWYFKIWYNRNVLSMNWHLPKYMMCYEYFELENTSDTPEKRLPGFEQLGITNLTEFGDSVLPLLNWRFLVSPSYIRTTDEISPVAPPRPIAPTLFK